MTATIQCPSCSSGMNQEMYEGINIDRCTDCGGTWLEWGELGPIIERRGKEFTREEEISHLEEKGEDASDGGPVSCPDCGSRMGVFEYAVNSGVFLNRCANRCGLYLDEGELKKVQIVMEEHDDRYRDVTAGDEEVTEPDVKHCPRCDSEMRETDYEGAKVDRCPDCSGTWCDFDELLHITETREKKFSEKRREKFSGKEEEAEVTTDEMSTSPELDCVICGDLMSRLNYQYTSGILVDSCPKGHGVWLDEGELKDVQVFEEQWEDREGDLEGKYIGSLLEARKEMEEREAKSLQDLKLSHFGFMNRFIRALARRGWFD